MKRLIIILFITGLSCSAPKEQTVGGPEKIRLNQLGFYPRAPKIAVILGEQKGIFKVSTTDLATEIYQGDLQKVQTQNGSVTVADFSALSEPGEYVLVIPEIGNSYPFEIVEDVHKEIGKAAIKAFYFHRASTELPEKFAGAWKRAAGHPDTAVLVHPSAATKFRKANSKISSPRGWYDAGDYNKYIVNSGITMGTLLSAYEDFPEYFQKQNLNIPESENNLPDILDESLWNLRWMLTMQDKDGGVYHKLTNPKFDDMVMPDACTNPRYVVKKSTAAALDFAAVMAQSSRIFKQFEKVRPRLSDSCLVAAKKAWEWAMENPDVEYDQDALNKNFDPDITTGAYGDKSFRDEFAWAAAELTITTGDGKYYKQFNPLSDPGLLIPSWNQVRMLGFYSLTRAKKLPATIQADTAIARRRIVQFCDSLIANAAGTPRQTIMGSSDKDFVWGSNSVAANQGIALVYAYRITNNKKYLAHALSNLDYILGRNGTGYSYVTGFGDRRPMHPHHRPSEADGIEDPVPGFLVGGPNPGMQDKCNYASTIPDEAYVDDVCSYASNEVAINWNAPLVYLVCAIEALQGEIR
jgi:endoglucanase